MSGLKTDNNVGIEKVTKIFNGTEIKASGAVGYTVGKVWGRETRQNACWSQEITAAEKN